MLPHAVDRRSSDSWSQVWSAVSDGSASRRSPSAISWRVRRMSSSRVTALQSTDGAPTGSLFTVADLTPYDIRWFESPAELRDWLDAHHAEAPELWVGMRPKSAGLPTVSWEEIVDEVLAYGWIDGIRKKTDGGSVIRITPR